MADERKEVGGEGNRSKGADEQGALFAGDVRKHTGDKERTGGGRGRTLALLLVVCVLAVGGYFGSQYWKPKPAETPPSTTPTSEPAFLLVDKTRADLKSVTVRNGASGYTIDYDGAVFSVSGLPGFTLDQSKAGNLATSATYLYANNIAESAEDLSVYGLANPRATVTANYTDGSSVTFLLGDNAPSGSRAYLKTADKPNIYTVYTSTGDRFTATLASLHIIPAWSIAAEDIRRVSLTRSDGTAVEVDQTNSTLGVSTIRLSKPFSYEADSEKISALYTSVTELKAAAFEANPADGTLGMYGLDNPRYILSVYGDALSPTPSPTPTPVPSPSLSGSILDMSATPEPTAVPVPTPTPTPPPADVRQGEERLLRLEVGSDKNDTQTYVRLEDGAVYLMDKASLDFLKTATAAQLVDRFANIVNITKIDGLTIQGLGVSETMGIERVPALNEDGSQKTDGNGKPATNDNFTINGQPADDSTFRKLYQIIIGTRVDGLIPEGKIPGSGVKPELTVTYTLDVSNGYGDRETIEYLPYDAENYAVRRNGVTLFYILKSRVRMIPDALNEYHAGTFEPSRYGV